jgi:hypothetical protein
MKTLTKRRSDELMHRPKYVSKQAHIFLYKKQSKSGGQLDQQTMADFHSPVTQ